MKEKNFADTTSKQRAKMHFEITFEFWKDIDFAEVMIETRINDTNSENDLDDTEALNATNTIDGEYMARIRDNIANMLWENLNS
ncbi:hypothetical protein Bca4012_005608 [Brassica carinata]